MVARSDIPTTDVSTANSMLSDSSEITKGILNSFHVSSYLVEESG